MEKSTARIHWLSITIFGMPEKSYEGLWAEYFQPYLGELVIVPGGARRGFNELYQALAGAKVYIKPVQQSPKGDYFCIDLPGAACEALMPDVFRDLQALKLSLSVGGGEMRISRVDVAVDYCPFTPFMIYSHFKQDLIKTFARRSSITWIETPAGKKEDGSIGTSSIYIGSNQSERMLRIYDKHGFTRAELQCRDEWANIVFGLVAQEKYSEWLVVVLNIINKFFSVKSVWWDEFIAIRQEMSIVVSSARVLTLNKMRRWVEKQVAPTIYVLRAVMGGAEFDLMINEIVKNNPLDKFGPVLQLGCG